MSQAYARIKAAVQSVADTAGGVVKIALGTTGSTVEYPTTGALQKVYDTGGVWEKSPKIHDRILDKVSDDLDRASCVWAEIVTNASLSAPAITGAVGITAVSKDEVQSTVTFTVSPTYANSIYAFHAYVFGQPYVMEQVSQTVSQFEVRFHTLAGAVVNINSLIVKAMACGQM